MKTTLPVFACLLGMLMFCAAIDVNKLLKQMTNEQKCGQMTQIAIDVIQKGGEPSDPDETPINLSALEQATKVIQVGSVLNTPYGKAQKAQTWQAIQKTIQEAARRNSNLSIPIIYGIDSIHGANYVREGTLFPQPLSMAASFDVEVAERVGAIGAMETRASGIPWNFNPVLDVGRQPLWSRIWETYGEDAYLASRIGEAYIRGNEGDDLKNDTKVASCLKHYIGYSYPFNGLDRTPAWIPEMLLREVFLPPFEAGVRAGSPTVMINSGDVNGIPGHANSFYINDILKGELKFDGFVVSDWEDIIRLHTRDKVAESPEEAVRMAVMAGVDMSMVPYDYSFYYNCVSLTKKDPKFAKRVNDAALRILKVKNKLGLFENPFPNPSRLKNVDTDESYDFNLQAARESVILAKNDKNTLPLAKSGKRVLVAGPSGNILRVLNGGWSYTWQGNVEDNFRQFGRPKKTLFEAVKGKTSQVTYSQGVDFNNAIDIRQTVEAAKSADVIILAIGEDCYCETPGNIDNLMISKSQSDLADALFALSKPVVVVYLGGRPRVITDIVNRADAVILGFLPGNRGAEAIADILFGDHNPSARLPITYPASPNGFVTYDRRPIEMFDSNFYRNLFPFGHGLSYTKFTYSNLKLNATNTRAPQGVKATVTVKNAGTREGKEVVLLYVQDDIASVSRPLKQLRGFKKISLKPNEQVNVEFDISTFDLTFINAKNKRVAESGNFHVYVSDLSALFYLDVPVGFKPPQKVTKATKPKTTSKPKTKKVTKILPKKTTTKETSTESTLD